MAGGVQVYGLAQAGHAGVSCWVWLEVGQTRRRHRVHRILSGQVGASAQREAFCADAPGGRSDQALKCRRRLHDKYCCKLQ